MCLNFSVCPEFRVVCEMYICLNLSVCPEFRVTCVIAHACVCVYVLPTSARGPLQSSNICQPVAVSMPPAVCVYASAYEASAVK